MRHQTQNGFHGIFVGIPQHQKGHLVYDFIQDSSAEKSKFNAFFPKIRRFHRAKPIGWHMITDLYYIYYWS